MKNQILILHNKEQNSDFICFGTAIEKHITTTLSGHFCSSSASLYAWHCTVHFYAPCRSLEFKNQHWCLPRATPPFFCRTGRCCLCWCIWMALPRGSVACPQQCLSMLFYCLDHQNKTASGELPIDIEVWPQTNLELCPRAVSDSACWLTPNSCQESVSMSGGTDYYILGPRNIPKNARYFPYWWIPSWYRICLEKDVLKIFKE